MLLTNSDVPPDHYKHFRKWLRYYLDFCQKYQHPYADDTSLELFLEKLKQKNQLADQRAQAQKAVRLYYSGLGQENDPQADASQSSDAESGRSFDTAQPADPWTGAMDSLRNEISVCHYSNKTWKAYSL